jgi:hypothetical protein
LTLKPVYELGPDKTIQVSYLPSWLQSVAAFNILEQNLAYNSYMSEVFRFCTAHGFTVKLMQPQILPKTPEAKQSLEEIKERRNEALSETLEQLKTLVPFEEDELNRLRYTHDTLEGEEKLRFRYSLWLENFKDPVDYVDFYVTAFGRNMGYIRNVAAARRLTADEMKNIRVDETTFRYFPELRKDFYLQYLAISDITKLMGLSSPFDTGDIHRATLDTQEIRQWFTTNRQMLMNRFSVGLTKSDTFKARMAAIKAVFMAWGRVGFKSTDSTRTVFHLEYPILTKLFPDRDATILDYADKSNFFINEQSQPSGAC